MLNYDVLLRDVTLPTDPRQPIDESSYVRVHPQAHSGAARVHTVLTHQRVTEQLTWLQSCVDLCIGEPT